MPCRTKKTIHYNVWPAILNPSVLPLPSFYKGRRFKMREKNPHNSHIPYWTEGSWPGGILPVKLSHFISSGWSNVESYLARCSPNHHRQNSKRQMHHLELIWSEKRGKFKKSKFLPLIACGWTIRWANVWRFGALRVMSKRKSALLINDVKVR